MQKYQQMVARMAEENKELFENFGDIHREYAMNPRQWQKLFNQYGTEVVEIIREYERFAPIWQPASTDYFQRICRRNSGMRYAPCSPKSTSSE